MIRTIAQRELRNDNAKIVDEVAAGESFIVTRNGEPLALLRPIGRGRPVTVPRLALVSVATQGPSLDAAAFRVDLDRLAGGGH